MGDRVQLWSCGGGRQSVLMLGLIKLGELPRPDHVVMVDTNRERQSTWDYVRQVIEPECRGLGLPFTIIDRSRYATVDLWSGEDGETLLIPAFTDQSGKPGKLPEFCSGQWKQRPVMRWATEQGRDWWPWLTHCSPEFHWKNLGVDCWLGITTEEKGRRRKPSSLWWHQTYPLLDVCPSHVSRVYEICERFGWPEPPRSCCWMCPNMGNAEWRDMRDHYPQDFAKAVQLEREVQEKDPHAWLHKKCIPLDVVDLGEPEAEGLFKGGCSSGMCY
jgi:hypothetical protein